MPSATSKIERKTISVEEAALELGLSRNAAYEAAKRGELPTIRMGRRLLVPRLALDALLNPRPVAREAA